MPHGHTPVGSCFSSGVRGAAAPPRQTNTAVRQTGDRHVIDYKILFQDQRKYTHLVQRRSLFCGLPKRVSLGLYKPYSCLANI